MIPVECGTISWPGEEHASVSAPAVTSTSVIVTSSEGGFAVEGGTSYNITVGIVSRTAGTGFTLTTNHSGQTGYKVNWAVIN
jgi:hypothetical protein